MAKAEKVVLITGASSGFGFLTAEKLLAEGVTLYAAARNTSAMQALARQGAHLLSLDVTDDSAVHAAIKHILREQGRIDLLINSAGFATYDLFESTPIDTAKAVFDVNVWGMVRVTQAVLPTMRAQRAGRIINISSIGGKVTFPMGGWYTASKHAVEALSDTLRMEVARFGVDVVVIEPGTFKTGFGDAVLTQLATHACPADYQAWVARFGEGYRQRQQQAPSAEPVVAAIFEAINAEKPQTRYLVGEDAQQLLQAKQVLSDREFDQQLLGKMGLG